MYTLAIYIYALGVHIAAFFSGKVKRMVRGQRETFRILERERQEGKDYVWFHAASLGEFEQGRPIMERMRKQCPEKKILLTFFSPSGYEVRKDWDGADIVCYLPLDLPGNVRRFLRLARPEKAFFIKYEFWMNYLSALREGGVPCYSVSAIFRPDQVFFCFWGKPYRRALRCFDRLFVQNERSRELLQGIGIGNVDVTGDTRFDRVLDIRRAAKPAPLVESFASGSRTLVAGSTWEPDEEILLSWLSTHQEWKIVLAPHVVNEAHLQDIERKIKGKSLRLSRAEDNAALREASCLIIDCYGLLSSIYRYGEVAYVGGGFGVGVHNVPEAAVYSVPVIVGPNNHKFREVRALVDSRGCREILSSSDFDAVMKEFSTSPESLKRSGEAAGRYIADNAGAADKVFNATLAC